MNATPPTRRRLATWSLYAVMALASHAAHSQDASTASASSEAGRKELVARGRYMVVTGHCNNCHTNGYAASSGSVPEDKWLTGNPVGWRSRQGTVYAPNLRLYLQSMDVDTWIFTVRNAKPRAPMPWWSLRETSDADLIAMYSYIRSLQPVGSPAPSDLPPDQAPKPPYDQLPDLSLPQ